MDHPPLAGVRVLDLTNVLAGPYCTYQLVLYGATVTKVEIPGRGDLARRLGWDERLAAQRLGSSFLAQNAGKRSIELDLTEPDSDAVLAELVADSDVLVENFRPRTLEKLGWSWDRLRELNPRLVYCSISGFGQEGPLSDRPAYDQIIQGLSGIMSVTGSPGGLPMRTGFPICDTLAGMAAAGAISAALMGRQHTGRGCRIDVSMLEVALSAMGWAVSNYLIDGHEPEAMSNENATASPSGMFETADRPLNIAANEQKQFEALCQVLDRPDLVEDVRFAARGARKRNRDALTAELTKSLRGRTAAEWDERLAAARVPAAEVLTVPEALELEQLRVRGFINELPFSDGSSRTLKVSGNGVLFDGVAMHATEPPPLLGQHNSTVIDSSTKRGTQ